MSITVYTVILNNYDNLRPPVVIEPGVKYICFSDQMLECEPWVIYPAPVLLGQVRRDSRVPKILSHLFISTEFSIYHDGCYRLTRRPSEMIFELLRTKDIAFYKHPCRLSIYEEMEICKRENIGYGPEMEAQVKRYREAGLKKGLWAGGFIVRRNSLAVQRFNEIWWQEYLNGCVRDQFALPMAQKLTGLDIKTINANILMDLSHLEFCWHAAFKRNGGDEQIEIDRQARMENRRRLETLCRIS